MTFDANGNRLSMTSGGVQTVYTYDKNDRLLTEKAGTNATVTYTYDNNGNMKTKTGGITQVFDALNRMTSYTKSGVTTAYTYYPDNMRKSKKICTAAETTHIWNDDEIALDMNGTTVVSSYIHGLELIRSGYGWYHYNAHGDVVQLTDSNGTVTRNYDYDPYGNQLGISSSDSNPYRYSGEYYDTESEYVYLRARYYDSSIGRFINEDPVFDGLNWYVYCANNPVNMVDPSGLAPGDLFVTPDDAAKDFAKCYNKKSIDDKREYGSIIYSKTVMVTGYYTKVKPMLYFDFNVYRFRIRFNTSLVYGTRSAIRYSYTKPLKGTKDSVLPNYFTINIFNMVGWIHTHANYDSNYGVGNENFSSTDLKTSNRFKINAYVVTPGGALKRYTYANRKKPNNGIKIVTTTGIPRDPNSPAKY